MWHASAANSGGCPSRDGNGICSPSAVRDSSGSAASSGVSKVPGAIVHTRMPVAGLARHPPIRELVAGQEAVVKTARSVFPLVDKVNDEPSADLLTQRMQVHEKTAWMLRSLLT